MNCILHSTIIANYIRGIFYNRTIIAISNSIIKPILGERYRIFKFANNIIISINNNIFNAILILPPLFLQILNIIRIFIKPQLTIFFCLIMNGLLHLLINSNNFRSTFTVFLHKENLVFKIAYHIVNRLFHFLECFF